MGRVAILGVFVADTAYRAARPPKMGETIMGKSFSLGPGGKGSNQSVAAARANGEVSFISKLGRDVFADMALSIWKEASVTPAITQPKGLSTGAAYIFIDDNSGDNAIIICPGAGGALSKGDVEDALNVIAGADVFVTQLEQPIDAAQHALELAKQNGVKTILNPAPATTLPPEIYEFCDIVTPNESEATALTGIDVVDIASAAKAGQAFLSFGVNAAIITLGAAGALLITQDQQLHVPALSAGPVVETTGAGDAFNGGLAVALSEGKSLEDAVRFGNATAALSVTREGTAPSMPKRTEIDALLQE